MLITSMGHRIVSMLVTGSMCLYSLFLLVTTSSVTLPKQIPCTVSLEEGVKYNTITWYKVSFESDSLVGLVMKDFRKNVTVLYKYANHSYKIGDNLTLLGLPESRQEECELYRCSVWPPVGHRILHGDYSYPEGCKTNLEEPSESTQVMGTKMNGTRNGPILVILAAALLIVMIICISVFAFLSKRRKTYTLVTL